MLRALPFGDPALAVVTGTLSRVGVGLHDDDAEVTSGNPVRLTRWQARNLAVEAANGGGIRGDVLNALAPVPAGAPPMPYLVAAWVKAYDSAGARFARELMGEQDWTHADQIPFPNLVLTLFLADALANSSAHRSPAAHSMALVAMAQAGPCTFASTFIQHAIADVAKALKVKASSGGLLGFLGTIWNVAVDMAAGLVKGLIDAVTKPVVDAMADVFGVVATITQLSSLLVKWRAELRPDPSHTRFGVDSEVVTGQFQLTVVQNQPPIPEIVLDCADAVGVDLRNAGSAAGSTVTWHDRNTGRADLSTRTGADDALAKDKTARYRYRTGQEPAELASSPDTETFALVVSASVHRNDVQKVRQMLTKLLFERIPADIRGIVEGLAKPLLNQADSRLAAITDLTASERVFITYHVPGKQSPAPNSPVPSAGTTGTLVVPTACPSRVLAEFGYDSLGSQMVDEVRTCFYFRNKSELGIGITHERGTPTWSPEGDEPIDIPGAKAAWYNNGAGSPSVRVFVSNGAILVSGGDGDRDELIAIAKRILGVG